jgi:hypothetical protein
MSPSALLRVVRQDVGDQRFSGITWASAAGSLVDEFGERDFSLFAICCARAALRERPRSVQVM